MSSASCRSRIQMKLITALLCDLAAAALWSPLNVLKQRFTGRGRCTFPSTAFLSVCLFEVPWEFIFLLFNWLVKLYFPKGKQRQMPRIGTSGFSQLATRWEPNNRLFRMAGTVKLTGMLTDKRFS